MGVSRVNIPGCGVNTHVSMPEFYYYVTLSQGYQQFFIKDKKDKVNNFSITEDGGTGASSRASFTATVQITDG